MKKDHLLLEIEEKRQEMYTSALQFGIESKKVLSCSEELDSLIAMYQQLKKRTSVH
ncbi:aspartyl-phosphate phosphatase Spo0E family protein [Bacillus sp. FJAT-45037]|uniref:aspartyl-phosphate phosphatase Spo0E family protein n=1 Tax=Bacillus sp. FJAT-45037 TaxID=2011007 RepID=UPI000C2372E0|nr:aspartyl-phosphate phosphatase Spo0E family protein [Bacillus sp. FJAT-45037]